MKPITSIFGRPSLGNHYKDAKALASLLNTMQSGISTFKRVHSALYQKHGNEFQKELIREVRR